jgi:hypothetical protein
MLNVKTEEEFRHLRRESLLEYSKYSRNFNSCTYAFEVVTESLIEPHPDATIYNFVESTSERAWSACRHLANCYSGGHSIADLRSFFPTVIDYWETYARYHRAFHSSTDCSNAKVAHIALTGPDFFQANRLVCFAILLGMNSQLPRLIPIIDYNNPQKDGLLERFFASVSGDREAAPKTCTRHLPYSKALKIFTAQQDERPALMADYLSDWYHASRREPYHATEQKRSFTGYWSYESAAITALLAIDDSNYKSMQFYPADLVEFARDTALCYEPAGVRPIGAGELRTRAGELCPIAGNWLSLDDKAETKYFATGDIMPNLGSPYGLTVWQYMIHTI